MKYYIISGEASGDLHGSNLVKEILKKDSSADIRAWGGDLMSEAGADVVKHYRDLAFMGFAEVIANIGTILKNFKRCKADILNFEPDVLILIDYPGFNLRMAEFAHKEGIKVFYYISPQIWAWKQNRVKKIRAYVDEMYVILPFEKDFYAKFDVDVHFVGHPLIDAVGQFKETLPDRESFFHEYGMTDRPLVLLMPGSRKQEINKMLPLMLEIAKKHSEYHFVVAGAPGQDKEFYDQFLADSDVQLISGKTYQLLSYARAALVTSGTATLETAIFRVPQVVCYRAGSVSYIIAKNLVKIAYISLVNLIMDREVVKELIQGELNLKKLEVEFSKIAKEGEPRTKQLSEYEELYEKLGGEGASALTAELMLKSLND
ncbi:MAG TPA: lipid-A-disaccharide synthase [Cryomorphaceae bacterium]|nr:lipid-A-disaccharide synthase [Cryomorphaceae bacterium]